METLIALIIQAGKDTLNVSLYILLPIMVVMMIVVKILDLLGILDKFIGWCAPFTKPFGLSGLGLLAMIQMGFVGIVAPLPTLKLMEEKGISEREIAASFAAILAMAPANGLFPLAVYGLSIEWALIYSFLGGLLAAATTYWVFGKSLNNCYDKVLPTQPNKTKKFSILSTINTSGKEAIELIINIIPMLLISLLIVQICQKIGMVEFLKELLSPLLESVGIDKQLVLPSLTKYLAGSTALVGVLQQMQANNTLSASMLNLASIGFLLNPIDLPGIAIFMAVGSRIKKVIIPALLGAILGISGRIALGLI